jgi:hypothetical protein
MPRYELTDDQILDESEKLFLELAKSYYRDLRHAAENAPAGKILRHVEVVVQEKGRELVRQSFENIMQEQNDVLEKKKGSVNANADENEDTSVTENIKH